MENEKKQTNVPIELNHAHPGKTDDPPSKATVDAAESAPSPDTASPTSPPPVPVGTLLQSKVINKINQTHVNSETKVKQTSALAAPAVPQDTPKPATWKNLEPSDPWCPIELKEDLGFTIDYKNEFQISEESQLGYVVTAATKRGRMHAHYGTHREDAFAFRHEKDFSIYCVCDGAGSSKLSRIGAEFTARNFCNFVGENLLAHGPEIQKCSKESLSKNLNTVLHKGIYTVAEKLVAFATKSSLPPKDFRCTVLTILHYQHPSGGWFVFGNVGDGFLALKRKDSPAERIGLSDRGAFAGQVLCFMPDQTVPGQTVSDFYIKSLENIPLVSAEEVETVMLCTDGIEDPFFPIHKTIPDLYQQLSDGFKEPLCDVTYPDGQKPSSVFNAEKPGEELLKWLGFEKRGENDDRTIMIIKKKTDKPIEATMSTLDSPAHLAFPSTNTTALQGKLKPHTGGAFFKFHLAKRIFVSAAIVLLMFLSFLLGRHFTWTPSWLHGWKKAPKPETSGAAVPADSINNVNL